MKAIAKKLAKELGPSQWILSSYVIKQTPQRKIPLLQLIETYIKIMGEQSFVEKYHDEDSLYNEFLERDSKSNGYVTIRYQGSIIARGQI
jgi:hypothetical protein